MGVILSKENKWGYFLILDQYIVKATRGRVICESYDLYKTRLVFVLVYEDRIYIVLKDKSCVLPSYRLTMRVITE